MYINDKFYEFLMTKPVFAKDKRIDAALKMANEKDLYLHELLYRQKIMDEKVVYKLLSIFYQLPYIEIGSLSLREEVTNLLPLHYLKELNLLPYKRENGKIHVALSKPQNLFKLEKIKYFIKEELLVQLITESNMAMLIEYLDNKSRKKEVLGEEKGKEIPVEATEEIVLADSPAVKLADSLLREAVASMASDIHIEPFEEDVVVRFRIDGHLVENTKFSKAIFQPLLARFKIIADLNIAERRVPQDGKIKLTVNQKEYDFRISTIPTINGEKIVIRIYNIDSSNQSIDKLGFFPDQYGSVKKMIEKPYGIVLVTGPTGSGKTTSLYTFLKTLNNESVNIITVEDPVENIIYGINQVQVNPKANLTFSTALRSILRQDPNIIMVGEIRDEETAQMAIRAAITGHLVFSTLHTNDALGAITRLMDMGVPRYLIADAVSGAIAQRLARKLCPHCKKRKKTKTAERMRLGLDKDRFIYRPHGCSECYHTGYRGRIGVFEIINIDSKLKLLIENPDVSIEEIRKHLDDHGFKNLQDNFRQLVIDGVTSLEEFDLIVNYD